jgi:hypothetical protein
MLLLCTGCAIAQALANKFKCFTNAPAQNRRALVLAELQNPECQRTVLGAAVADLEARFTLSPELPREVSWSRSVAKAVTEALGPDLPVFKRMHELCRLFVSNVASPAPAAEALAITAGPTEPRCDLPSALAQPGDLVAHAGFLLQQISHQRPTALIGPLSAYGSVPAVQLLKELARSGSSAVIHELDLENNDKLVVYTVADIRKKGQGVSAAKVLHDSRGIATGVTDARVEFPRKGWFLVAVSPLAAECGANRK